MTDGILAWHFTGNTLRDGRPIPKPGETLIHDGPIEWCQSGLYASRHLIDALSHAPGHMIHRVRCEQIEREDGCKLVCRRRSTISSIDGTDVLRAFARRQALSVIHLWDAPLVVREYLETGDKTIRDAARASARVSTKDAARAASWACAAMVDKASWLAAVREVLLAVWDASTTEAARDSANDMLTEMVVDAMGVTS